MISVSPANADRSNFPADLELFFFSCGVPWPPPRAEREGSPTNQERIFLTVLHGVGPPAGIPSLWKPLRGL